MIDLSSFDSLLEYLTLSNIECEYESNKRNALSKNKALQWLDNNTMALIVNPDGEDIYIYSNQPDYKKKIEKAKKEGKRIHYSNFSSDYNIIDENVTPDVLDAINSYEYQLLPAKLEEMVNSIKSDLKNILIQGNYDSIIKYLKGSIQTKLQQEINLFKQPLFSKKI